MRNTPKTDAALQEFKADKASELLDFLIEKQVRKSRNAIKSLLSHKQIKVNSKLVTQFNHELKVGDTVSVMKFDQSRKEKKLKGLKIVFEDKDLIVIDKEAGYLTISTEKEKLRTVYGSLNEYVKKKKNERVFVLHRLDREASGLMVFARSEETQAMFQKNWEKLVMKHTYTAVVEGKPKNKKGTIISWLTENKNYMMFSTPIDNGGLKAITHYTFEKGTERYSQLSLNLETRRKNQLRVQLQSIGLPIVGDKKYGAESNPIKRIALHASEMLIKHPATGEILEFRSTVPKAMQQLTKEQSKREEKGEKGETEE